MNNGKNFNYDKGALVMKHQPPQRRIYGNVAKQFIEIRGSWIFKHPPPS